MSSLSPFRKHLDDVVFSKGSIPILLISREIYPQRKNLSEANILVVMYHSRSTTSYSTSSSVVAPKALNPGSRGEKTVDVPLYREASCELQQIFCFPENAKRKSRSKNKMRRSKTSQGALGSGKDVSHGTGRKGKKDFELSFKSSSMQQKKSGMEVSSTSSIMSTTSTPSSTTVTTSVWKSCKVRQQREPKPRTGKALFPDDIPFPMDDFQGDATSEKYVTSPSPSPSPTLSFPSHTQSKSPGAIGVGVAASSKVVGFGNSTTGTPSLTIQRTTSSGMMNKSSGSGIHIGVGNAYMYPGSSAGSQPIAIGGGMSQGSSAATSPGNSSYLTGQSGGGLPGFSPITTSFEESYMAGLPLPTPPSRVHNPIIMNSPFQRDTFMSSFFTSPQNSGTSGGNGVFLFPPSPANASPSFQDRAHLILNSQGQFHGQAFHFQPKSVNQQQQQQHQTQGLSSDEGVPSTTNKTNAHEEKKDFLKPESAKEQDGPNRKHGRSRSLSVGDNPDIFSLVCGAA